MARFLRIISVCAAAIFAMILFSAEAAANDRHHRKHHRFEHHGDHAIHRTFRHGHHRYHNHRRHRFSWHFHSGHYRPTYFYPSYHYYGRHGHHGYLSLVIGPSLYYYADHHFYRRHPESREYILVDRPDGADNALLAAASEDMYIYPREGQTPEEQDRDRYDCHVWATEQTGVDPSLTSAAAEDVLDYRRASAACLEGRGYTVK